MSNAVATVAFLQGQAWAKSPDGSLRPLSVGSVLNSDETLVTAQGAQVQLDFGNGEPVQVNGGLEVAMSRDFNNDTATDADDAALNDASVQEALTVLEQGGDLLEELEETAAGDNGGGGSDGNNSFVQLTRIFEQTDSQFFTYQNTATTENAVEETDGNGVYVNRAPSVTDQALAGNEDEIISGQIIATDIEGDTLTYSVTTAPTNGTLTLDTATGQFTFTPNANYNGSDSFVVTVTDGRGNSSISTVSLNIAPVNDAPTTSNISLTTDEDVSVSGQVIAQDIEGDTLGYTVSGQPTNGTVTLNAATGSFVYTPNANYNGSDSFVITISDGKGGTTTSTITIGVTPANDAPTSSNQNLTTAEDTDLTGQIVANDIDGDALGYTVSGQPTNGTVTLNPATGSFVYTPNANYNGSDSFVVTISDGKGGTTTSTITIGVTPANDAPTSSNQNLTTAEDTDLTGQIVANDVDGDALGYTVSGQPANGTVTLNAATGSFVYTPNANYNGSDSFVVTIGDGKGGTTTSTITIGVTPANDAPEAGNVSLTTDEDVPVNGAITASDLDGDTLSYTISGSPANGSVVLNTATGTFTYTPNTGYAGGDSFVVTVSDGKGGTTTSTVTIGVNPVNHAPTAAADNTTTNEDTAVTIAVRGNDIDPDGDSLTVTGVTQGANGSVVIDAVTGNPIYTPNSGFTGTDQFTYTIDDGNGGTSTATVSVVVNPVNHVPVAVADSITVTEGGVATTLNGGATSLLANDSDSDGDPLVAVLVSGPANGTLTLNPNGTFSYIHNGSETTTDSFTYKVNDGTVDGNTVTVNITVNPVNDVPVANDDSYTINEDQTLSISLSSLTLNDTDADGDSLTVAQVLNPVHGSVSVVGGNFVFTPDANFSGTASFDYRISDGKGGESTATVHIKVVAVDDPTTVTPDTRTTAEDTATTGNVLSNDSDVDNTLAVASFSINGTTYNANDTAVITGVGSLKLESNGSYLFQPVADYNGAVPTVTYTTNTGVSSTLDITVTPVNDDPVANDDSLTINMNSTLTISPAVANSFLANDTDVDGDTLAVDMVLDANHGTISFVGNDILFTPDAGFSGVASFTYYISDGQGGSSSATVYVNVVNQPSVLTADVKTTDEDTPVTGNVLSNDTDPDEALSIVGFSINGNNYVAGATANISLVGSITLQANGVYTFTPAPEYSGAVPTLTYTTNTGFSSTLNITVTPVNDAPVTVADSITVTEGGTATVLVGGATSVLANDTDAENNPLTAVLVSGPTNGTLTLNANGTFSYVHNGSETTTDSFTYRANDGTANGNIVTVNINVTPVNNAPVAVADSIVVAEGGTATVLVGGATSVLANDTDAENNLLNAILVSGPTNGTLTLNANGTFSYVHNGSETTTDSFTYKVNDGSVDGNTVTVNITVTPVNDAPVANDDTASVNEDDSVVVAVLGNDTDAEGNLLTVTGVTQGANGSVVIDAVSGNPIYTPNAGFSGVDTFTYTISDGNGISTATVTVTVNPINHAPVAVADSITLLEGGTATSLDGGGTSVLANDTDPDGNPLTAILVSGPAHGTLTLNANGTFSYVHDGSETTTDSFTYKVNDGTVDGNTVTVNINVTPVNEKPVAVDDYYTTAEDTPIVFNLSDWLVNDSDPDGDTIAAYSAGAVVNGSLSYVGGKLTFTPDAEFSGQASFKYSIHDGHGNTATATVYITVTNVDDPSILVADTLHSNEDTVASGNVLSNDSDVDDVLQVVSFIVNGINYSAGDVVSVGGIGSLTMQASGAFTFTPAPNYNGPVPQITYTTNTGFSSTLDITIDPVNDAPVANADFLTTTKNTAIEINLADLTANDTDIDGNTLTVFAAGAVNNGSLAYIGGKLHFIPAANYTGPASFTYSITDGHGGTASATVHITVVAPPNVLPETNNVTASGDEDTLITVNLSGSDSDGSVAGYVIKSLPANGVLYSDALMNNPISVGALVTGPVYFKPNADWNGNTSFNYATSDNSGAEDLTPATASITINPVADAAIVGTGTGTVKEDTPAQTSATGTLSIVDPDAGEAEFIAQTNTAGTYGSFSISALGTWVYNLDNSRPGVQALKEGETRTEIFNVVSKDGTPTTVTVTVTGTNDGPVAVGESATVFQGSTLSLTPAQLLINDFDIDGDTLSISSVQGAVNGSVSLVGGNVVFTPTAGYSGPASFTYTATDSKGGTSTATVSITVLPNTAPDAVDDPSGASAYSVAFGDASATDLWTNLDSKGLVVNIIGYNTANVATALYQGTVDGNANSIGVQGTPRSFSDVPNQIEYDVATGKSESIVMSFNGNLNQASFGVNRLFPGESGGEIGLWEAYFNGVLVASSTFRLLGTSEAGTFSINTGSVVFNSIKFSALHTNNSTGDGGDYFLTSFSGTGPASANSSLKVIAGSSNTINAATLLANDTDADNDTLSIISVQGATNGTVSLVAGNVVFTPTTGYTGPASFSYTISDGHGGTDTATVNISVERFNTAPHTVSDSVSVATGSTITIASSTLLANDSDAEGDAFSLVSVQSAVNGTVSIVGANVIFTPISNYEGQASFTYTVRDTQGATSTATVNVGVGSASTPSVVVSRSLVAVAHGTGGTSVKFPIITKLVDTDGSETLSIKVSNVPTGVGFNKGTNLGGGVWQFTEAELSNLTLILPGSYTTNATHMTVQVTSTEINGGFTASVSSVVTLKAAYTTVDITTTESGSYTGSSASEYIDGGNGNNTINGANGNNIINGGGGNDNLSAGSGSDIINGGSGNDTINSGSGSDRISGGSGNDTLIGGDAGENFVDVFVWSLGDQGAAGTPAVDTIQNFATAAAGSNTTGGDVLDLRDLLQGESVGASNGAGNLANYLHFEVSGGNTIVHISHTGGFTADSHSVSGSYTSGAETQQIVLSGVNLQSLYSGATTDQQIITQLLNNNKLITD